MNLFIYYTAKIKPVRQLYKKFRFHPAGNGSEKLRGVLSNTPASMWVICRFKFIFLYG